MHGKEWELGGACCWCVWQQVYVLCWFFSPGKTTSKSEKEEFSAAVQDRVSYVPLRFVAVLPAMLTQHVGHVVTVM
jgi:hypothetical protein